MEYDGHGGNIGPEPEPTFWEKFDDALFPSSPERVAMNLAIYAMGSISIIVLMLKLKGH